MHHFLKGVVHFPLLSFGRANNCLPIHILKDRYSKQRSKEETYAHSIFLPRRCPFDAYLRTRVRKTIRGEEKVLHPSVVATYDPITSVIAAIGV
jgi:hypothetical protein